MSIINQINENVKKYYLETNDNIKSVMLGYKYINKIQTKNIGLVFIVEEKKPIADLAPNEIIPRYIEINNKQYITDVIEDRTTVHALTCYSSSSPEVLKMQSSPSLSLPIKGGQEVIQFPTKWQNIANGQYSFSAGTLGFLAVDNEDNRIVGVTNAHVGCFSILSNSIRINVNQEKFDPYNLYDERTWIVDSNKYRPGLINRDGNSLVPTSQRIAFDIKRYVPFFDTSVLNNTNRSDVCLISLNKNYINTSESYKIHMPDGVVYNDYLPFATTNEINNLLINNNKIYSTGRSTGPKGWGSTAACRLLVDGLFVNLAVRFIDRDNLERYINFSDIIRYRYEDFSNFPNAPGDSGSALLAEIGGRLKIIGLVFAGNSGSFDQPSVGTHYGYACRIDRISEDINIREWNSGYNPDTSDGSKLFFTKSVGDIGFSEKLLNIDGKNYYNIGLTNKNLPTPTPTVSVSAQEPDIPPFIVESPIPTQTITITKTLTPTPTITSTNMTPTPTLTPTKSKTIFNPL